MEIKNVALERAAAQRQRTENAKPQKAEEESREDRGDRLSISAEAGQRAEPGSGRIQDAEAARGAMRELSENIANDGAAAMTAHGRVSAQVMKVLEAA